MQKVTGTKGLYNTLGVYAIKNKVVDKWYFGSSISTKSACKGIGGRLRRHLWELRRGEHHNAYLQASWNKYGEEAFELYLVEQIEDEEIVDHYFDIYDYD